MGTDKHAALMTIIVPGVVGLICERQGVDEVAALRMFVESRTYAALEDEETKVWRFSPETLYLMLEGERATGYVTFPEEA